MARLDFSNISDSGFEPVPVGIYEVTVFECEEKEGKDSGQPYFNFQLAIQGGEFDNRRVFTTATLQPKGLWRLKEIIQAVLGEPADTEMDIDTEDFIGKPCKVKVTQEKYKNPDTGEEKTQNRVAKWYPINSNVEAAPVAPKPAPKGAFGKKAAKAGAN